MFLARIVIPFSFSRSIESMTRSATSWFSRNAPDCHSILSTSVVLPWSTWATIATLRRSERVATGVSEGVEGNDPSLRRARNGPTIDERRMVGPVVGRLEGRRRYRPASAMKSSAMPPASSLSMSNRLLSSVSVSVSMAALISFSSVARSSP